MAFHISTSHRGNDCLQCERVQCRSRHVSLFNFFHIWSELCRTPEIRMHRMATNVTHQQRALRAPNQKERATKRTVTRFKCVVCGKITAGRLPREHRHCPGDTSFYFPRRHSINGEQCDGSLKEAEWVEVEVSGVVGAVSCSANYTDAEKDLAARNIEYSMIHFPTR